MHFENMKCGLHLLSSAMDVDIVTTSRAYPTKRRCVVFRFGGTKECTNTVQPSFPSPANQQRYRLMWIGPVVVPCLKNRKEGNEGEGTTCCASPIQSSSFGKHVPRTQV